METGKHDRAAGLQPITGHEEFCSRLKKLLLDAVQPMVDGVEIAPIPCATDASRGYVKCLIPASDKTPHRAMFAEREYWARSTEGFQRLEHWALEDMFGRRPIPRLRLSFRLVENGSISGGGQPTQHRGFAVAVITNEGRGSARAPYLALTLAAGPYAFVPPPATGKADGLTRRPTSDQRRVVFASSDVVIHPGVEHEVTFIPVHTYVTTKATITLPQELRIAYELAAENTQLQRGELVVDGKTIARAILPPGLAEGVV